MIDNKITCTEHHLSITADPGRMKLIANAIYSYMDTMAIEDTTLSDLAYNMECEYQRVFNLEDDDWGWSNDDKYIEDYVAEKTIDGVICRDCKEGQCCSMNEKVKECNGTNINCRNFIFHL